MASNAAAAWAACASVRASSTMLATGRPSLPMSKIAATRSILSNWRRIFSISTYFMAQGGGAVIGFERFHVIALADIGIAQQPMDLSLAWIFNGGVAQVANDLRH